MDSGKKIVTEDSTTFYEEGKARLAMRLCLLLCGMFGAMSFFELFQSTKNLILDLFCLVLSAAFYFYIRKTGRFKEIYFLASLSVSLICFFSLTIFLQDLHFAVFLWMVFAILTAYWGVGVWAGTLMLGINVASAFIYHLFFLRENLESLRPITSSVLTGITIEMMVALIAISLLLHQFILNYQRSLQHLQEGNRRLLESNNLIAARDRENTLLLKEVHHRVKNNLQIIVSLLRLQSSGMSPEVEKRFDEAINRILTMAMIHRQLYQSENLSAVEMEAFIHDLASGQLKNQNIQIEVKSELKHFGLKTIVPLGLLLNELLSNSFKHAFKEHSQGKIRVSISSINTEGFELFYDDGGTDIMEDVIKRGFGMELIETLAEQLEGSFTRKGFSYLFRLKNLDI